MAQAALAGEDVRRQARDTVEYRARATTRDGRRLSLLVVNISVQGLMARCDRDADVGVDERLRVMLPVVGEVAGVVRWALGGRIGCELDQPIGAARYHEMLKKVGHRPA